MTNLRIFRTFFLKSKLPTSDGGILFLLLFRREASQCKICFFPAINAAAPVSFGLSNSIATMAEVGVTDSMCTLDYIGVSLVIYSYVSPTYRGSDI